MVKKKEAKAKKAEKKVILVTGKRKESVARGVVKPGKGRVRINSIPLEIWGTELMRMRVMEPLVLAGELAKKVDFEIRVDGGGTTGQADSIRQVIAKGLVEFFGSEELKQKFLAYDRNLLVPDVRRCEPHKPSRSKAGSRRHKQRSKR